MHKLAGCMSLSSINVKTKLDVQLMHMASISVIEKLLRPFELNESNQGYQTLLNFKGQLKANASHHIRLTQNLHRRSKNLKGKVLLEEY
jgi:hypothetical protein